MFETERLIFRRFNPDDVDKLYELDNDPEVMRYLNGGIPTPRQVFNQKIFPGFLNYNQHYPLFGFWALEAKPAKIFIGWISYRPTDFNNHMVALGFRLRKIAWGAGYASEGARAIIAKGFSETEIQRVVATTYEANHGSQRVLEKCGMRLVRKFRLSQEDLAKTDTFYVAATEIWDGSDLEYAITKSEWELSQANPMNYE